jgi:hypothetical protein
MPDLIASRANFFRCNWRCTYDHNKEVRCESAEKLAKNIIVNYDNQLRSNTALTAKRRRNRTGRRRTCAIVPCVVDALNQRFGNEFTAAELFWEEVRADASADKSVRDGGEANSLDNFAYVFDPKPEALVMNRMDRNSD